MIKRFLFIFLLIFVIQAANAEVSYDYRSVTMLDFQVPNDLTIYQIDCKNINIQGSTQFSI